MGVRIPPFALVARSAPRTSSAAPALPDADPAIWVVKDPDTTIYLFGTFHALDGSTDWFNEEVKAAFDQSNELVLEIPPAQDQSAMQQVIAKYALDTSGKPLSSKLSPAARDKLTKALAGIGAPPTAFDKFKPFFAALMLDLSFKESNVIIGSLMNPRGLITWQSIWLGLVYSVGLLISIYLLPANSHLSYAVSRLVES